MQMIGKYYMNPDRVIIVDGAMRQNVIETEDDLLQLADPVEDTFYDFQKIDATFLPPLRQPHPLTGAINQVYMAVGFQVSTEVIKHTRSIYGLMDLFGDFGGFMEVLLLVSSLFLAPVSAHGFLVKAIQKLYIVRTRKKNIFKESESMKTLLKNEK